MRKRFRTLTALVLAWLLLMQPWLANANEMSNSTWSETDASNNSASPNGWTPGSMLPNQVEPTAQAMMGALKRWWNRSACTVTTTGSSPHYIYTPVNTTYPTAWQAGEAFCFVANFTSAGNDDLNVMGASGAGLGALPLYKPTASGPAKIAAGDIQNGQSALVSYNSALNAGGGGLAILSMLPAGSSSFTGGVLSSTTSMNGVAFNEAAGTVASSSTVAIGAANANQLSVTGTNTITAFDTVQAGTLRFLTFAGTLTLTYNATSLILPTAANITTAANDTALFQSLGSGNWICLFYQRADGTVLTTTAVAKGGTGQTSFAAHQAIIATGSTTLAGKTIPNCTDTGGNHLNYTQSSDSYSCGTTSTGGALLHDQIFTSNGTFTAPSGTTSSTIFKVTLTGGGGASGGVNGGGGGGSGGTAIYYCTGLTAGNTVSVTIGGAGVNSSIVCNGTTVTAAHGAAGASGGAGGNGGGTTNASISMVGQPGFGGDGASNEGNGGPSFWGMNYGSGAGANGSAIGGIALFEWVL